MARVYCVSFSKSGSTNPFFVTSLTVNFWIKTNPIKTITRRKWIKYKKWIKSSIKIKSPLSNEIFYKKDTINFLLDINNNEVKIDSSILYHDDNSITFTNKTNLPTNSILKFGKNNFKIRTWLSNGKIENHLRTIYLYPKESTKELFFEITNIFPHNKDSYTQGLSIDNKILYESTGKYGKSTIKKVNL